MPRRSGVNLDSLEKCGLDERTYHLSRLAALVAMDAAPVSYLINLGAAVDAGVTEVVGIVTLPGPVDPARSGQCAFDDVAERLGAEVVETADVNSEETLTAVRALRPDLAIIAFATNNMFAPRIWRVEKVINGEPRVITTFEPTETPDFASSYETYILHPKAQGQWCEEHKNGGELDRVGLEIIDKYLRFRPQRFSVFTPWHSFLWQRIVHGDAFYSKGERSFGPTTSANSMEKDGRLIAAIKTLESAGIPYILVHLPFYPEVKSGEEYSVPAATEIAREIGRLSGRRVHGLLDYIPRPISNPERMNHSPENLHPSTWGMQMYADAVGKIVFKASFERHSER